MASLSEWVWFAAAARNINPERAFDLLKHFKGPSRVFAADRGELLQTKILSEGEEAPLLDKSMGEADRILADCADKGITILTYENPIYPEYLKLIRDPPAVLFVRGKFPDFSRSAAVAVIGTRKCTVSGRRVARAFGNDLARAGVIVVTGMADGIDSEASRAAIAANAPSVVVFGCGVDVCYPKSSRDVYDDVTHCGAMISEYLPGTEPAGRNFPRRNRIMSALSHAVVVIEAPTGSGALITAHCAYDQERTVYAVPGSVDTPTMAGNNMLLQSQIAVPAIDARAVINDLASVYPEKYAHVAQPLNPFSRRARYSGWSPPDAGSVRSEQKPPEASGQPAAPRAQSEVGQPRNEQTRQTQTPAAKAPQQAQSAQPARSKAYPDSLTPEQRTIAEYLRDGRKQMDQIIKNTNLGSGTVMSTLIILETLGVVKRHDGAIYELC